MQALLKITEFKDAQASLNIKGAGKLITPLGATLIHVPSMDAKKIIALDKNCALEMVQAGDVLTDYDKLIDLLAAAGHNTTVVANYSSMMEFRKHIAARLGLAGFWEG